MSTHTTEPEHIFIYEVNNSDMAKKISINFPIIATLAFYMSDAREGQKIYLNSTLKKEILDKLGFSKGHLDNTLSKLVKQGILARIGSGTYSVNPYLFGKGEWKDIYKLRMNPIFNKKENDNE